MGLYTFNSIKRTVDPTDEPVTLAQARAHLRIDSEEQDALIDGLIAAAREWCETYQRRAFITQTWRMMLEAFPPYCYDSGEISRVARATDIIVPRPPLQSVTSITYSDANGDSQTLATSVYAVDADSEPGVISLKYGQSWPTVRSEIRSPITITYVAGYGADPEHVPARVRQAMLIGIGDLFGNPSGMTISEAAQETMKSLLIQERVWL